MGSKLVIDEDYHLIQLSEPEMVKVLNDIAGIEDLIEPEITIQGNVVKFRSEDLKVMSPELFFKRNGMGISFIEYLKQPRFILFCSVAFALLFAIGLSVLDHFKSDLVWVITFMLWVFGVGVAFAIHHSSQLERQRRATYVKASLVIHFYMLVMDDMTNCNGRLSRTCNQFEKEQAELHDDLDKIVNGLPSDYRNRFSHLRDHKGRSVVRLDPLPKEPIKYS